MSLQKNCSKVSKVCALPRLLMVASAVYPRLVLNYEFSHFSSRPTQLRISKSAKNIHLVLPNQNLRQICQGFMSYDRTFKKAKKKHRLLI